MPRINIKHTFLVTRQFLYPSPRFGLDSLSQSIRPISSLQEPRSATKLISQAHRHRWQFSITSISLDRSSFFLKSRYFISNFRSLILVDATNSSKQLTLHSLGLLFPEPRSATKQQTKVHCQLVGRFSLTMNRRMESSTMNQPSI